MSASPDESLGAYLQRRMVELEIGSQREFGRRVGVSPETARRLILGTAQPDEATLRKLAEKLPAPLTHLRVLAGRPAGTGHPFLLPPEADQLDHEQRAVVLSMINVLLRSTPSSDRLSVPRDRPRIAARKRQPKE